MDERYYSQRQKGMNLQISPDFLTAWLSTMKELGTDNFFCEHFPNECGDGYHVGYDSNSIQEKIHSELGNLEFESFTTTLLRQKEIFDLIEFFFRFVSKPEKSQYHNYCGSLHPESFNMPKGRYDYTIKINNLFKRFNHPYKLKNGKIIRIGSPTLDTPLCSLELETDDVHLKKLIEKALTDFYDRSGSRKHFALQTIVDAFERLKTIENSNKKISVAKVIKKLSSFDIVQNNLDKDLRSLTKIGNDFLIRHHEMTKKRIDDPDMTEFLFYMYFNYVRLILKKYKLIKENLNIEEELPL